MNKMDASSREPQPLSILAELIRLAELIPLTLIHLDALNMARLVVAYPEFGVYVVAVLQQRAAASGRVLPDQLPSGSSARATYLAKLEWEWSLSRKREAWAPVACDFIGCSSYFVLHDGSLVRGAIDADGRYELGQVTRLRSTFRSVYSRCWFSAAISTNGGVYTWGVGSGGALGHGDELFVHAPKQVRALAGYNVISVATGTYHCIAVTESGEVFTWGKILNNDPGMHDILPRRVEALVGVSARSAAAGDRHGLVVTENGALYAFGQNDAGQLGLEDQSAEERSHPCMVDALRDVHITSAAAGEDHSLALSEYGDVYAWGSNYFGQLGVSSAESPTIIERLAPVHVRSIAAGRFSSGAVSTSGHLFTWGNNDASQLGHAAVQVNHPTQVDRIENVVAVSIGHVHTIAVTRDGSVFGWGRMPPETNNSAQTTPHRYRNLLCLPVDFE